MLAYLRDPQEIYRLSFETIRREANEVIARVRERVEGELAAGG